jgi:hypothetical protein
MDKLEYYALYFACAHKDFMHDIEAKKTADKAYYAVAYFEKDNEFVRNFNQAHSPAVVVRDMVETFERDKKLIGMRDIYFIGKVNGNMSKTQKQDDEQIVELRRQLRLYALEFRDWLRVQRREKGVLRDLLLDDATIVGMEERFNGWHGVCFSVPQLLPLGCLNRGNFREIDPETLKPIEPPSDTPEQSETELGSETEGTGD